MRFYECNGWMNAMVMNAMHKDLCNEIENNLAIF